MPDCSSKGEVPGPHREGGGLYQATLGGQTLPQREGGGPGPCAAEREVYYTNPVRGRRYSRGSHRREPSYKKKHLPCHLKRSKVRLVTNPKQPIISHIQKNLMSRKTLQIVSHRYKKPGALTTRNLSE